MGRLAGKICVVTGAARGIGLAISTRYLEEGACCFLVDRDEAQLKAAGEHLRERRLDAHAIAADLTRQDDIDRVVGRVTETAGRIDVLVNNAGAADISPLLETSRDSWSRIFDINVTSLFFMLQAAARQMLAQGGGGRIINMASEVSWRPAAFAVPYAASKSAVVSITRSAAHAFAKDGILVNAIAPGLVDTRMWDEIDESFARQGIMARGDVKKNGAATTPIGRAAVPADLVGAAVFLASDDSAYVVGHTLDVNGGRIMS